MFSKSAHSSHSDPVELDRSMLLFGSTSLLIIIEPCEMLNYCFKHNKFYMFFFNIFLEFNPLLNLVINNYDVPFKYIYINNYDVLQMP